MSMSASLEIHQINVGQGDSILIINRDLEALAEAVRKTKPKQALEPIDYLPYAVKYSRDNPKKPNLLLGTVKKAVLIDAGDDEYGGDVIEYLEVLGAVNPDEKFCENLTLVATHYHDDHIAGLRSVFKKLEEVKVIAPPKTKKAKTSKTSTASTATVATKKKEVDRYRPAHVYHTRWDKSSDNKTNRLKNFKKDIKNAAAFSAQPTETHPIDPGGLENGAQLVIELGDGIDKIPIRLLGFAASRYVYNGLSAAKNKATQTPKLVEVKPKSEPKTTGKKKKQTKAPDPNDRSIALILEYGSFRYYLGGDVGGDGDTSGGNGAFSMKPKPNKGKKQQAFSEHANVEGPLGSALENVLVTTSKPMTGKPKFKTAGHCTVFKADHHGSSSSTDIYLLATLKPKIGIITTGVKARWHNHPTQEVLDRMSKLPGKSPKWSLRNGKGTTPNTLEGIYINEMAEKHKGQAFGVDTNGAKILGDIIIRPVDETIKAIQDAKAFGQKLKVQVYGTGALTSVEDKTTTLRATEPKRDQEIYPIKPAYHECDQH